MAHAATGPGRVVVSPQAPMGGIRAVLSNFDVDSDQPKKEHTEFLDRRVIPLISGKPARVWLRGEASHTGSDEHNLDLSKRRASKVADYLVSRGIARGNIVWEAVGESLAGPKLGENDEARAVSMLAAALATIPAPPPPPPVPIPTTLPRNTHFKIQALGGISGGMGPAQVDTVYFNIWDVTNSLSGIYHYQGGGGGKGVKLPLSCTLKGPWNDMQTTGPLAVDEFAGSARWTSGGGGPWSWNYLNMMSLPRGIATVPRSMSLSTGFTIGLGVGSTVGALMLLLAGPFKGP